MSEIITSSMDICVIFFDLMVFTRMITLKKDVRRTRMYMYIACVVITVAFFAATYVWGVPASIASALCMSIPSMTIFFILSKHKDARFFLTFCFVDTVTLILDFFARYIGVQFGLAGKVVTLLGLIVILILIFRLGRPYFQKYRDLLEYGDAGWGAMMASSAVIYFALVFLAAYPKPLVERLEYAPSYLVFSMVVLSSYLVFITSAVKTRKIYQQGEQIKKNQEWYHIAYIDGLTGCSNRMAYIEKINEIERARTPEMSICMIVLDLDNFKEINDTKGHNTGDVVLQDVANLISEIFSDRIFSVFRLGGDEFAVIAEKSTEEEIQEKLLLVESRLSMYEDPCRCSISAGFSFLDAKENNAVARAFDRADQNMYLDKHSKKSKI